MKEEHKLENENSLIREWKRDIESWLAERYVEKDEDYELFCQVWKRFKSEDVTDL